MLSLRFFKVVQDVDTKTLSSQGSKLLVGEQTATLKYILTDKLFRFNIKFIEISSALTRLPSRNFRRLPTGSQ